MNIVYIVMNSLGLNYLFRKKYLLKVNFMNISLTITEHISVQFPSPLQKEKYEEVKKSKKLSCIYFADQ